MPRVSRYVEESCVHIKLFPRAVHVRAYGADRD